MLPWLTPAFAADAWTIHARPKVEILEATYADPGREPTTLRARFPVGALTGAATYDGDHASMMADLTLRLTAWAAAEAPRVQVTATDDSPRIAAPPELYGAVDAAWNGLMDRIHAERRLFRPDDAHVHTDHVRIVEESVAQVRPLADELAAGDTRERAARILRFVQAIPYEAGVDLQVRSPLAVLADHQGDCDEKTALFLALLRAVDPEVGLAVFDTAGHAWPAIAIPALPGERTEARDGTVWLLAEAAGPALSPLGTIGPEANTALAAGDVQVYRIR